MILNQHSLWILNGYCDETTQAKNKTSSIHFWLQTDLNSIQQQLYSCRWSNGNNSTEHFWIHVSGIAVFGKKFCYLIASYLIVPLLFGVRNVFSCDNKFLTFICKLAGCLEFVIHAKVISYKSNLFNECMPNRKWLCNKIIWWHSKHICFINAFFNRLNVQKWQSIDIQRNKLKSVNSRLIKYCFY